MVKLKKAPIGIKIISIIVILLSLFLLLAGVVYMDIGFVILGAFSIWASIEMWKLKRWARITIIVILFLETLIAFLDIFIGIFGNNGIIADSIGIVIYIIMVLYLLFSKSVRKSFAK
jgi:hypothetical protein